MTQSNSLPDTAPTVRSPKASALRPAVADRLAALLRRDDDIVIAIILAELVTGHTEALFAAGGERSGAGPDDGSGGGSGEGLAARAAEAVRARLDDRLNGDSTGIHSTLSQAGRARLVGQTGPLLAAFAARAAVVEERVRRARLRHEMADAIAALAESARQDPDAIGLLAGRLEPILRAGAPLYPAADLDALAVTARLTVAEAAAGALIRAQPAVAARRLTAAPYPEMLGKEGSAHLAAFAAALAPAMAEDSLHERLWRDAAESLETAATALIGILHLDHPEWYGRFGAD